MRTTSQKLPALLAGMTALVISAGATVATAQDDVRRAGDSTEQTARDQANATDDLDRQRGDAYDEDTTGRQRSSAGQDLDANGSEPSSEQPATRSVPPAQATRMPEPASTSAASTSSESTSSESTSSALAAREDDDQDLASSGRSSGDESATGAERLEQDRSRRDDVNRSQDTRDEARAVSSAQGSSMQDASSGDDSASSTGDVAGNGSDDEDTTRSVPPAHATRMPRQMARNAGTSVDAEREVANSSERANGDASDSDESRAADGRDSKSDSPDRESSDRSRAANDDDANSPDDSATRSVPPAHATRMPPARPSGTSSASLREADEQAVTAQHAVPSSPAANSVVTNRSSEEPAPADETARSTSGTVREAMPSSSASVIARDRARDASSDETARANGRNSESAPASSDEHARDSGRADDTSDTIANRDEESNLRNPGKRLDSMTASARSKFEALDSDHDGYIDASEAAASDALDAQFSTLDTSGDGRLSVSEFGAASNIASIKIDRRNADQQQE